MAVKDWPEPSDHTRSRADAYVTANQVIDLVALEKRGTSHLRKTADDCWKTFRGAAERDFMDQCRRQPSAVELDRYCRDILATS